MIFPRETNDDGKDVVRLYTQINKKDGAEKDVKGGVKIRAGDVKVEDIMEADRKVYHCKIGLTSDFLSLYFGIRGDRMVDSLSNWPAYRFEVFD